jgi:hypothetical protein
MMQANFVFQEDMCRKVDRCVLFENMLYSMQTHVEKSSNPNIKFLLKALSRQKKMKQCSAKLSTFIFSALFLTTFTTRSTTPPNSRFLEIIVNGRDTFFRNVRSHCYPYSFCPVYFPPSKLENIGDKGTAQQNINYLIGFIFGWNLLFEHGLSPSFDLILHLGNRQFRSFEFEADSSGKTVKQMIPFWSKNQWTKIRSISFELKRE